MKTGNTKWAATATVLVAMVGGFILLNKAVPSAFALERVIEAYNHVRFLHVKSFQAGQKEPNEFWIQSDASGRVARARYYLPVTQDGVKLITWTPERAELWFMSKRRFLILQTKRIQPRMQSFLEQSQPQLVVKHLAEAKKAGKLDIQFEDSRDPHKLVRMTVVHKTEPNKEVYYIDPQTELITRIEFYQAGSGGDVLKSTTEFCDYNVAIDEKMFSLQAELPKDVRIADQLSQVIGVAQGNLTDEQAAVETVRQFFQALVDKDYKTAGRIVGGELAEYAQAEYGKVNVTAILSVGPAVLQTNWEKRGYRVPCELAIVHADGEKGVWNPGAYVRPGDDESHPDRWNITGGVSASDAELRILPDNETYEKMAPKEAAQAFLKACAESNWDEFLKFWSMSWSASDKRFKRMQEYLGGLKVISLGEPFRTNTYAGWYVPYEIQLPPMEINVRVANTNTAKRYVPTGVYDRKLQLQQEFSWTSEPALLPNNELYARMSPVEVVKAWTEAQAKLDWDELAKFVPQQEVQNAKFRAEAAQQSGLAPRQSPATEVIEAVWSAEQSAYFVKCRVVAPVKKWNLAIRNDNPAKRFLFDGGL